MRKVPLTAAEPSSVLRSVGNSLFGAKKTAVLEVGEFGVRRQQMLGESRSARALPSAPAKIPCAVVEIAISDPNR